MGLETENNIGDDISITCSTDLKVSRIVWLNNAQEEIAASQSLLTLNFNSVTESMNNAQFVCRAESKFGNQSIAITLSVTGSSTGGESFGAIVGGAIGGLIVLLLIPTVLVILYCCLYKK